MIKQGSPVVPPKPNDQDLSDFSQIIQNSFLALFQAGHFHTIVTTAPASNVGAVGDIYLGNLTSGKKIYVKFSDGWYAVGVTKI